MGKDHLSFKDFTIFLNIMNWSNSSIKSHLRELNRKVEFSDKMLEEYLI